MTATIAPAPMLDFPEGACHLTACCATAADVEAWSELFHQWVPACRHHATRFALTYRVSKPCPECDDVTGAGDGDGHRVAGVDEYGMQRTVVCFACSGSATVYDVFGDRGPSETDEMGTPPW